MCVEARNNGSSSTTSATTVPAQQPINLQDNVEHGVAPRFASKKQKSGRFIPTPVKGRFDSGTYELTTELAELLQDEAASRAKIARGEHAVKSTMEFQGR